MITIIEFTYKFDCGHESSVVKEYDFTKEADIYKYDSFIQFNKIGNDMWCVRCQKQKSLIGLSLWKLRI